MPSWSSWRQQSWFTEPLAQRLAWSRPQEGLARLLQRPEEGSSEEEESRSKGMPVSEVTRKVGSNGKICDLYFNSTYVYVCAHTRTLDTRVNVHTITREPADESMALMLTSVLPSWSWNDVDLEVPKSRDAEGLVSWPGEGQHVGRASRSTTKTL